MIVASKLQTRRKSAKSVFEDTKNINSKTHNMKNTIYYFCLLLAVIGFTVTAMGTKQILNDTTLTLTGIYTTSVSGLLFLIISYKDKNKN
jgi:hypothetical protein